MGPPYWIDMGAMAISTLSGGVLIVNAPSDPLLLRLLPFLEELTLLFWATATWWIPMLVIFGYWRHVVRRYPLRDDPSYWAMVFPLGMYSACTFTLAGALDVAFLRVIAQVFVYIAVATWLAMGIGLVRSVHIRGRPAAADTTSSR